QNPRWKQKTRASSWSTMPGFVQQLRRSRQEKHSAARLGADLRAGEVLLPLTQHQPTANQKVFRRDGPLCVVDALVIYVRTALLNGSAGRTIGLLQTSGDEQLDEARSHCALRDRRLLQSRGESLLVELAQVSATEQRLGSQLDLADGVLTVNQRGHLLGENTLRLPLERALGDLHGKAVDLLAVQEGEHAEELHHVGVGG